MKPKNRAEYREHIAQVFIDALNEDGLEWKAGWDAASTAPINAVTGTHYRGLNEFYLSLIALKRGYKDPRWATMTQIMDVKGLYHPKQKWHLQAGSKAVFVEYWYPYDIDGKRMMTWKEFRRLTADERNSERYTLRCRYTPVFHASMIEGIPEWKKPERVPQKLSEIVKTLSANMGVELLYDGGSRAYYRYTEDKIHLPEPSAFRDRYEFNATALHELAHATGHETRLARPMSALFGAPAYAYEELVAEITSCFMSVEVDAKQTPQHTANHKAYIQSWIEVIQEKPETLVKAIADAQRAASYMDYKAELITEEEYNMTQSNAISVPAKNVSDAETWRMPVFDVPIIVDEDLMPATDFYDYARKMQYPDPTFIDMPQETNEYVTRLINANLVTAREALDIGGRVDFRAPGVFIIKDSTNYTFDDAGREGIAFPDANVMCSVFSEAFPERDFYLPDFVPYQERLTAVMEYEAVNYLAARLTQYDARRGLAVAAFDKAESRIAYQKISEFYQKIAAEAAQNHATFEKMEKTFTIYQLGSSANDNLRFRDLRTLREKGWPVELKNYEKLYTETLTPGTTLENIYERFNIGLRPAGFTGHSLSVSDVVVISYPAEPLRAYYVDDFGFKEVPELAQEIEDVQQEKDVADYEKYQKRTGLCASGENEADIFRTAREMCGNMPMSECDELEL